METLLYLFFFFFSSRRRHTRFKCDWSSDVCSSDLNMIGRQMGEATSPPTEPVPSPPAATLSAEARIRAFDFVWSTINEHYYDPSLNGVDWKGARERYRPMALAAANDDDFWDVLDRMTGELKDAHT